MGNSLYNDFVAMTATATAVGDFAAMALGGLSFYFYSAGVVEALATVALVAVLAVRLVQRRQTFAQPLTNRRLFPSSTNRPMV